MPHALAKTVLTGSWIAGEDLRAHQFKAVQAGEDGAMVRSDGTALVMGILQDQPILGEQGLVMVLGVSKCIVDGSGTEIGVGMALSVGDDDGVLVPADTDEQPVVGFALQGTAETGAIISVLLTPGAHFHT